MTQQFPESASCFRSRPFLERVGRFWNQFDAGVVLHGQWSSPAEVKALYGSASILKDGRVVFNIGGNKYRLVVWINYKFYTIYVRFVGTHEEYDEIDAQTI